MISAEVDALAAPFKQFLKEVQQLIMEKELPEELVTSTRKRVGPCRQSMPKDAKAKLIATRDNSNSKRGVWTKALQRAVQQANAPPEDSSSDESLPEEQSP